MPPNVALGPRLIALTLALEEALRREAWDEADDLFAARDDLLIDVPGNAVPREVDEIDARILSALQRGQMDVRVEMIAVASNRQAVVAYRSAPGPTTARAA